MKEKLNKKILKLAIKLYLKDRGFKAYLWQEWAKANNLPVQEHEIDLVVENNENIYAVQCKKWDNEFTWKDLGSFVGVLLNRKYNFTNGLIIAEDITSTALQHLNSFEKEIKFISSTEIEIEKYINKAKYILEGRISESKTLKRKEKKLRPYQKEALERITEGFKTYDRGKLIMPPGTGKTLVALRLAEEFYQQNPKSLVLFLCYSIDLLDHAITTWLEDRKMNFNAFALDYERSESLRSILFYLISSDPEKFYDGVKKALKDKKPIVIFSTYHSLDVVKKAQQKGLREFDLVICDWGNHKFTDYEKINYVKAKKHLYVADSLKMFDIKNSNESILGPTFYDCTLKRAIDEGFAEEYKWVNFLNLQEVFRFNLNLSHFLDLFIYKYTIFSNPSEEELEKNIKCFIDTFNEYLKKKEKSDPIQVQEAILEIIGERLNKERLEFLEFSKEKIFKVFYRPFVPIFIYVDFYIIGEDFYNKIKNFVSLFNKETENLAIVVPSNIRTDYISIHTYRRMFHFDALVVDKMVTYFFFSYYSRSVVFPFYIYTANYKIHNVSSDALKMLRQFDDKIKEEDVFYYVFGVLSNPTYQERFKNRLRMELPRVPLPENAKTFWEVSKLGRDLATFQLNYLNLKECDEGFEVIAKDEDLKEPVKSVRISKENLILNEKVIVRDIPSYAWEYKVAGYSPISWISEYLVKQVGITNRTWDPKITVKDFISLARKLATLSKEALEIKRKLAEVMEFTC